MTDEQLLSAFEELSLPLSALTHREHVRLAWLYLSRDSFGTAGDRFCASLRRYAESHGKTTLFHATITWAYLTLIHARPPAATFDAFASANPDLMDHRNALRRVYDDALLASAAARERFVLPENHCHCGTCGRS